MVWDYVTRSKRSAEWGGNWRGWGGQEAKGLERGRKKWAVCGFGCVASDGRCICTVRARAQAAPNLDQLGKKDAELGNMRALPRTRLPRVKKYLIRQLYGTPYPRLECNMYLLLVLGR